MKKKKQSLCCGTSQFLLVVFRNTTTRREGETKTDQIDYEARHISGEALSKQNIKASLALLA